MTTAVREKIETQGPSPSHIEVHGVKLEVRRRGSGRPLLYLHAEMGLDPFGRDLAPLDGLGELIAPSMPGFGSSELPRHVSTADDLSYIVLDFLKAQNLRDVILVGTSFGAWVAAATAVKSCERLAALVLAGPVGTKWGAPDEVEIADMFMLSREEFHELAYADPKVARRDPAELDDAGIGIMARNWEAIALFGWLPYMHDPKLRHHLHRIDIPTLLIWGEQDRVVSEKYVRNIAQEIPGAIVKTVPGSGHYPNIEAPEQYAKIVKDFIKSPAVSARAANAVSTSK